MNFAKDDEAFPGALTQHEFRHRIEQKVRELMVTKLGVRPETLQNSDSSTSLLGSGIGLDSMEALTLAVELEEAFAIEIADEDLTATLFSSFDALTDYLVKRQRNG